MTANTTFKTEEVGKLDNLSNLVEAPVDSQNISESVMKVKALLDKCKKFDAFNNCFFDFSDIPDFNDNKEIKTIRNLLPIIIKEQKDKHVIGLKLLPAHARIVKYAIEVGFVFHDANSEGMLMTLCLKGHHATACSFPKFMTASIGVTGVVFDKNLEKVLLIQEKWGGLTNMKPPTGTVDYLEAGEDPLKAVVRELKEETNIDVDSSEAVLVGNTWTQKLRGNNPDINYVFAFKTSTETSLQAQEEEIAHVCWQPIEDYLKEDTEKTDQPYVMKRIVAAALHALKHRTEWIPCYLYWTNSKPVTLFCFNSDHH